MIIYRLDLIDSPPVLPAPRPAQCVIVGTAASAFKHFPLWVKNWGLRESVRAALKVLTGKRIAYFTVLGWDIVQSGWANIGFCDYYHVEPDAVVLGTLYTRPEHRRKGFSTSAKSQVIAYLYRRGFRRLYADTQEANIAAQRTSEKLGFQRINEPQEAVVA